MEPPDELFVQLVYIICKESIKQQIQHSKRFLRKLLTMITFSHAIMIEYEPCCHTTFSGDGRLLKILTLIVNLNIL